MLLISAPFGNYFRAKGAISTLGTFTIEARPGRWLQALRTIRHANGGWLNQMGLRNPGIEAAWRNLQRDGIVSLHGANFAEWERLYLYASSHFAHSQEFELNLSCPNMLNIDVREVGEICKKFQECFPTTIVKLPPVGYRDLFRTAFVEGVRLFHCCNSYPTPLGGISGKPLMSFSLAAIQELKAAEPSARIIGGGGIQTARDIQLYRDSGAEHFAVGSALLEPLFHLRKGLATLVAEAGSLPLLSRPKPSNE